MTAPRWWERWLGLLEYELAAFKTHGFKVELDEKAKEKRGVIRLLVRDQAAGDTTHPLEVVFPDEYPFFPPLVFDRHSSFRYHQNPFRKNLCLVERSTIAWHRFDMAAEMVREQVPKLVELNRPSVETAPNEKPQAEPITEYFDYTLPAMILVDEPWTMPLDVRSGSLTARVGLLPLGEVTVLRGLLWEVRTDDGYRLGGADRRLSNLFPTPIPGRWARATREDIAGKHSAKEFYDLAIDLDPAGSMTEPTKTAPWTIDLRALFIPLEVGHRVMGEGWVFAVSLKKSSLAQPHQGQPRRPRPAPWKFPT